MSKALIDQEIIFAGTTVSGTPSGSYAYFPQSLRGQYSEWTVIVEYTSGSTAGKVQVETAWANKNQGIADYSGVWANVGSTIDWATGNSQKYASVTGVFDLLRLEVTTSVATAPVRAYVMAASKAP